MPQELGLAPLSFQVCFTVQKVPWSGRYLVSIFICQFHPITSGYTHVVYSHKQFFSSMAVCVFHTGITYFPSYYHPFFLSPFINQSLQPLYHLCHWSSLIPIQLVMDTHVVSHHSFICLQAASKACTESVTWHGYESDVFHLAVPLQSVFLHRHSGEDGRPEFQFSAWSFNTSSFWDHW